MSGESRWGSSWSLSGVECIFQICLPSSSPYTERMRRCKGRTHLKGKESWVNIASMNSSSQAYVCRESSIITSKVKILSIWLRLLSYMGCWETPVSYKEVPASHPKGHGETLRLLKRAGNSGSYSSYYSCIMNDPKTSWLNTAIFSRSWFCGSGIWEGLRWAILSSSLTWLLSNVDLGFGHLKTPLGWTSKMPQHGLPSWNSKMPQAVVAGSSAGMSTGTSTCVFPCMEITR